jgi:hypothetical protein
MLKLRRRPKGGRKITKDDVGPFYCGVCGREVDPFVEECTHCGSMLTNVYDTHSITGKEVVEEVRDEFDTLKKAETALADATGSFDFLSNPTKTVREIRQEIRNEILRMKDVRDSLMYTPSSIVEAGRSGIINGLIMAYEMTGEKWKL